MPGVLPWRAWDRARRRVPTSCATQRRPRRAPCSAPAAPGWPWWRTSPASTPRRRRAAWSTASPSAPTATTASARGATSRRCRASLSLLTPERAGRRRRATGRAGRRRHEPRPRPAERTAQRPRPAGAGRPRTRAGPRACRRCAVRVLDRRGLERRRMGAFLATAQASSRPPLLIALEHTPQRAPRRRGEVVLGIVGKGLTYRQRRLQPEAAELAGRHEVRHVGRGRGDRGDLRDRRAGPAAARRHGGRRLREHGRPRTR